MHFASLAHRVVVWLQDTPAGRTRARSASILATSCAWTLSLLDRLVTHAPLRSPPPPIPGPTTSAHEEHVECSWEVFLVVAESRSCVCRRRAWAHGGWWLCGQHPSRRAPCCEHMKCGHGGIVLPPAACPGHFSLQPIDGRNCSFGAWRCAWLVSVALAKRPWLRRHPASWLRAPGSCRMGGHSPSSGKLGCPCLQ